MDSNKDYAAIDINLAESLSQKFKTLHYPSSEQCCIYRVPQSQRCLNPSDYTPQIVSIGPLHYGSPELKSMEDDKLRYLHHFVQRTKVSMPQFVAFIREKEARLRNCYAETIHLESDVFVAMVLADAVFLIELFLRKYKRVFRTDDDPLFRETGVSYLGLHIRYDLFLVENQLPLFILSDLFDLAKTTTYIGDIYLEISLLTIIRSFFSQQPDFLPIGDTSLIDTHFSKAEHIIDLVMLCLHPTSESHTQSACNHQNIPRITELHQAGVKFESMSSGNLFDIKFNNGILGIPFLKEFGSTKLLYRNLIAFEIMQHYPHYFNDYVVFMSYLLRTPKDAELLNRNEVIKISDSERFSTALQSLRKDTLAFHEFYYSDVVKDLQAFYKSPWHRWMANLKQNYFNTPWVSISVIAAVILLLLTVTQAVCAIIAL